MGIKRLKLFSLSMALIITLSSVLSMPLYSFAEDSLRLKESDIIDKIEGSWIGQMAGVAWGAPTEFRYMGKMIPEDAVPVWYPDLINTAFEQDDVYVEIPLMDAMKNKGVNLTWKDLGEYFRKTRFSLWHANYSARTNLNSGIGVPDSGHYNYNKEADDIDWQIESDFVGLMSPGQLNTAIDLSWKTGHITNYGDGVYGGVFVSAMHSRAFTATSVDEIIDAGRQAVPVGSQYRQVLDDVITWKAEGKNWQENWQLIQDKWGDKDRCPDGKDKPLNIDAKLNGAYVLLGLLYGDGDIEKSMKIAMQSGQDSDCNPSTVGSILGNWLGASKIPDKWKSSLLRTGRNFSHTSYDYNSIIRLNLELARKILKLDGGSISNGNWIIKGQGPVKPPILEQWPEAENFKPVLTASAKGKGLTVEFTASAKDEDGILDYQWFFGDLTYENMPTLFHTYPSAGVYQAVCYVTDKKGNTSWKAFNIQTFDSEKARVKVTPVDSTLPASNNLIKNSGELADVTWLWGKWTSYIVSLLRNNIR